MDDPVAGSERRRRALQLLVAAVIIDLIGVLTYLVPFIGESFDIAWAPVSAALVRRLFPTAPVYFPLLAFVEELLPATDVVPTAVLTWIYVHAVAARSHQEG